MKLNRLLSRRVGLSLLVLVLLVLFAMVVVRAGPLAPVRVTLVSTSEGTIRPALFGIGTVEAQRSYLVGPTTAGRVRQVLVDVGETVRAGQLLAEMDPVDLDERIGALGASVARANSTILAAEAQQQDAVARHRLAAANTRRYLDLGEKKFVSPSAIEIKQQEQISAEAGIDVAAANLAAARQELQRLQAEKAGLLQQRRNIRLLAPADGVITARDAEAGSTVVAGQAVIRLVEPGSLWVRVRLDQARSRGLALGLPAEIALRSNISQASPGKVARLELVSDSVTEERVVQVAFDQIPSGVALGELAEVSLQLPATENALLLPNASIKRLGEQRGVWVFRDGKIGFVPVKLGVSSLDGQVQVLDGLPIGAQVVVHSEKELTSGSRVKVVDSLAGGGA